MRTLRERILVGRRFKLQALLFCILAWCLALFVYGFVEYTDSPYKLCQGGLYCGKTGMVYPYETYAAWKRWMGLLFASWPFGMLAGYALRHLRKPVA